MDLPSPLPALTQLLPLIFTSSPSPLPSSLISTPLSLSHRYLSPDPSTPSYYQLVHSPLLSDKFRQTVEKGIENVHVGKVGYHVDSEDITSSISIQDSGISIIMRWQESQSTEEGEEGDGERVEAGWRFHTIALKGSFGGQYYSTVNAALEALNDVETSRGPAPGSIDIEAAEGGRGKNREDMAQGEGTTPGAYGSAGDFWDGWSDDGESPDTQATSPSFGETSKGSENSYWDRYEDNSSVIDDKDGEREDEEGEPRERETMDLDSGEHLDFSRPPSIAPRSRRSSTIRGPLQQQQNSFPSLAGAFPTSTLPSAIVGSGSQRSPGPGLGLNEAEETKTPQFQPLPASSYLSPSEQEQYADLQQKNSLTDLPSPLHLPMSSTSSEPASTEGKDAESLRFAMAGLWGLYVGGSKGEERVEKAKQWERIAGMVIRS